MFEWFSAREPLVVYAFLLFNAFFESIFPPYPSDAFVLVFAFLAGQGFFNPYIVYACTVLGSIVGIMVLYWIGRRVGDSVVQIFSKSFFGRIIPVRLIEKAKRKLATRGDVIILLNRFLPGMRAPLCFAAGLARSNTKKFFIYGSMSVLMWNLFLVVAGFSVGATWREASYFLRNYNIIIASMFIVFLTIFIMMYVRKKSNT